MKTLCLAFAVFVGATSIGCAEPIEPLQFADRKFQPFQRQVYPVLLRDCGFPACHGSQERFFRVWGPGRTRMPSLDEMTGEMITPGPFDSPTGEEQLASYTLALSMLEERDITQSLLLRKPLAVEAGGAGHFGTDLYGRDVYRTTQDSGYVVLARWVLSAQEETP